MPKNNAQSRNRWFSGLRILIAALIMAPSPLWANPSGGTVASGSATISSSGSTLTVNQASNLAIINWHDFSINSGELTKFVQPSALSAALNRVTGGDPSAIYGTLQANGRIYLINPNGIMVGPSGVINTQSFVASALDVSNSQFLAGGDLTFSGNSLAGVSNAGQINALGGDILLVAHTVQNTGSLTASGGTAGLAAGSEVLFTASGNQRVFVQAGSGSAATGVDQQGQIQAATAELAAAGGNIYGLAVNNGGSIQATGVNNVGGHIFLTSNGGAVANSGSLSATGQGGQVTVTGGQISLGGSVTSDGAQAYAGPVLLTANDTLTGDGIAFQGTVDGAQTLTLNPGQGTVTFDGVVGGQTPLAALAVTGVTDVETGEITTSGDQTFNGGLIVNPNAILTSLAGNLNFNGSVNVGNNLTTNSAQDTVFNSSVFLGGSLTSNITSPVGSIDLLYGSLNNPGTITSGGDQTYNGPVSVGMPMELSSLYGNVTFNGTIDGGSELWTNSALNTNFNQAVGGTTPLNSLFSAITGPGEINLNGGTVVTSNEQDYNGVVFAQPNTVLTSAGVINFDQAVNAGFNLTTNAPSTAFVGPVFIGDGLTTGGSVFIAGGSVVSGGDQTYNGPITLRSDTTFNSLFGNLTFNGSINPETIGDNGGTTPPSQTNASATTNSAWNTSFNGPIQLTGSLTSTAQEINLNGGSVVTGGNQTYNGPVYAQPDTTLTSSAGSLVFNGAVNEGNSLVTNSALNTDFNGPVSLGNSLTSNITSSGGKIILTDLVVSGGDQIYNGPIDLLSSGGNFNSLFGNLTFNGLIDGFTDGSDGSNPRNLTTNSGWNTTFNSPVDVAGITVTGHQINLNGGSFGGVDRGTTINGAVVLGHDTNFITDGPGVVFNGTVDGGYELTLGGQGNFTFNGAVGSITPLAGLNSSSSGDVALYLNGGLIRTVGDQVYDQNQDDSLFLGSDNTLTSLAGNINFNGTVDGHYNLTTNSYLNTNVYAPIGSETPLASLTADITGPGSINLHGNTVTTTGAQTYNGPLTR